VLLLATGECRRLLLLTVLYPLTESENQNNEGIVGKIKITSVTLSQMEQYHKYKGTLQK